MTRGSCHCGAVTLSVAHDPEWVGSCNCSICRKLAWLVAYYPESEVTIEGDTDTYVWGDHMLALHRCRVCGLVTHWRTIEPHRNPTRMGVNARLLDGFDVAKVEVRMFDNAG